jgi:hypothetical protein
MPEAKLGVVSCHVGRLPHSLPGWAGGQWAGDVSWLVSISIVDERPQVVASHFRRVCTTVRPQTTLADGFTSCFTTRRVCTLVTKMSVSQISVTTEISVHNVRKFHPRGHELFFPQGACTICDSHRPPALDLRTPFCCCSLFFTHCIIVHQTKATSSPTNLPVHPAQSSARSATHSHRTDQLMSLGCLLVIDITTRASVLVRTAHVSVIWCARELGSFGECVCEDLFVTSRRQSVQGGGRQHLERGYWAYLTKSQINSQYFVLSPPTEH